MEESFEFNKPAKNMNIPSGTGANPAHKRQGSSSSFSVDINSLNIRLANLENFMFMAKLMQDDILVPSKLKDKMFGKRHNFLDH